MPRNPEEKEKCQEKLGQMQKFLPFLDFMIDKIKKKNDASLECQLNKFHVLRSMIAEKNEKYTWDALIKVEHIIEKLILKLDYKGNFGTSKSSSEVKEIQSTKPQFSASKPRAPSTAKSEEQKTQPDVPKFHIFNSNAVELIVKSIKMSARAKSDNQNQMDKDKDASPPLEEKSKCEVSGKTPETDLDKGLDGFNLTNSNNTSAENPKGCVSYDSTSVGKVSFQEDLLSSSREKLLKSLQDRLFSNRVEHTSPLLLVHKTNPPSNSETTIKSAEQTCEIKRGSVEINEHNVCRTQNTKNRAPEKSNSVFSRSPKTFGLLEKERSDSNSNEFNLKQKLKEKLSTDISEVYRVPGKSVGGSLRCLKDSRDHKKNNFLEEEELFKPDVVTKVNVPSRSSSSSFQSPNEAKEKSRQDSTVSELRMEKNNDRSSSNFSGGVKNKQEERHSKLSEFKSNISLDRKFSNVCDKKDVNKLSEKKEKSEKHLEMTKLNDDELTEFVKENIEHLPHLAKLKPSELRKTVESSLADVVIVSDAEILSDDSLPEFDEFLTNTSKTTNDLKSSSLSANGNSKSKSKTKSKGKNKGKGKGTERPPLASLKIAEVDVDSECKNIKPGLSSSTDAKVLEDTGDKIPDIDLVSSAESVDEEEDYAIKLIEETTLKNILSKKKKRKKGLLDLPITDTSDLFDDITSIESFESSNSPNESRDPRLKKYAEVPKNENKHNKIESKFQQTLGLEAKCQEGLSSASLSVEINSGGTHRFEHGLDEWPLSASRFSEDSNRCGNKYSRELKNSYMKTCKTSYYNIDPRLPPHSSSEPKSYAEYKRMKRKEQDKLAHYETGPRETTERFCESNISENSHSLSDIVRSNSMKISSNSRPKHKSSNDKNSWSGSFSSGRSLNSNKTKKAKNKKSKSLEISRIHKDSQNGKKRREDDSKEITDEKRLIVATSVLISPLEKLYQTENKPKTGRGYGIQHFKIPKKTLNPNPKSNGGQGSLNETNDIAKNDSQAQVLNSQTEAEFSKTNSTKGITIDSVISDPQIDKTKTRVVTVDPNEKANEEDEVSSKATNKSLCSENKEDINKVISAKAKHKAGNEVNSQTIMNSKTGDEPFSEVRSKMDSYDDIQKINNEVQEKTVVEITSKVTDTEPVRKYEPKIVECDSSMENTISDAAKPSKESNVRDEKSTVISKEEITQEFVEALIRKSFESGQGKLLLAQAKLFEELGRKLNSKKLKTIQKIINSESDSTSSSESTSSFNGKRRKKSKKSKKIRKRGRKNKNLVISSTSATSSSSYSSENEESDEEKNSKKKRPESPERQVKLSNSTPSGENEAKKKEPAGKVKSKKKKRLDYPGCFSRKRNKRKQLKKNKLIEKILNEAPDNTEEAPAKEPEPKVKPKPKTKTKTELDKLHEDIKNMFISSGVVTATGQRMCRILRKSGGKMDNLDIVKESAKMVEEEKLKKDQTHSRSARPRNATGQGNRSRSQSVDKTLDRLSFNNRMEIECDQDPKLKSKPYVLLQKVDLNNFGYGVRISDDCISFCRVQGRNTALRGFKNFTSERTLNGLTRNLSKGVFLARNKRKYERLNGKICKTKYVGKKLMDVVQNLPLKMAKIKHLKLCERKNDDTRKKKVIPEKLEKKMLRLGETKHFSDDDLVNHAFQLRKTRYRCKVCSQNFRNITEHYKTVHPEHGVLISRLCQKEAARAKLDALNKNYSGEENAGKEACKGQTRTNFFYQCRMCGWTKTNDVNVFYTHVTTHTGELRFQCPNEDCSTQTASREEIKFHILTKHLKTRYELYNKIIELYPSPVEGCRLFGFLCSKCNFVQLSHSNIKSHVSKQHPSEDVTILKINMSSDDSNHSKIKHSITKNNTRKDSENSEKIGKCGKSSKHKSEETVEVEGTDLNNVDSQTGVDVGRPQRQKSESEPDESNDEAVVSSTTKNLFQNSEKISVEVDENARVIEAEVQNENGSFEEIVDVKDVSDIEVNNTQGPSGNRNGIIESLEVGPLKYLLLENSEVYYKCRVKNCGLFTKGFEKFEQHLTYSHYKKKWNGVCKICSLKVSNDLLSALKHLKFHILNSKPVASDEKSKPNKVESLSEKVVIKSEESGPVKEGILSSQEVENTDFPYPMKPLLKVRNLVGDRLSTPKESIDERGVISIPETTASETLQTDMFTIENVRSLKSEMEPDANEISREQVCIVKDQHLGGSQVNPGKVILVRSCPTRKIAIRPENNNSVTLDVGQFNLVQTPVATHPVVLSQVSPNTPIHLLSPLQPVGQNSRIAIKPVIVTGGATLKGNSNVMPIIRPSPASATVLPVSGNTSDIGENLQMSTLKENTDANPLSALKHTAEVTVSEVSNSEEQEEKELIKSLRVLTNIGSKTVKDSTIYKQMLTKTKLCHLFKCMAVECSFTCNSESVFTRHIGLHEAQLRLKKKKGLKGNVSPLNKSNKAFQWQQCAYCCQIFNNSDNALSRHIFSEHGYCIYQCAYCFYRALSQNYVEIHQNVAHSQILKTSGRIIYKCKPLTTLPSRPKSLEKRGKKLSVRPYVCDQCGKNFYVVQEFLGHLTTEHQAVTAYTCHICKNLCFKANRLINHYKLHSYCTYQCAYCLHGTETELEMVFHLCNFHCSQPPVMYLRALPEGVESQGISQLESLKVVVYENDSLNEDCILEADAESEEDATYDPLKESVDFSEIVAELGINSGHSECEVTPLLKELASLSDQSAKDVTVKTLLPNAQFSSENDNINEGCSVLISSGVNVPPTQNDDKEMSIPLGQLPLEALNIKHVQHSSSSKNAEMPKKRPNSNENADGEDDAEEEEEEEETERSNEKRTLEPFTTYVHNFPQLLLTRTLNPKNVYPSKRVTSTKRTSEDLIRGEARVPEENGPAHENMSSKDDQKARCSKNKSNNVSNGDNGDCIDLKHESAVKDPIAVKESSRPLITSVVSLSKSDFCDEPNESISRIVINIPSGVNPSVTLKPPVQGVDSFQLDDSSQSLDGNSELVIDETHTEKDKAGDADLGPSSPDVVILEENTPNKDIETVTLDSDDEKDAEESKVKEDDNSKSTTESSVANGEIRKEMEMLRHQMSNETDSLLFDHSKVNNKSRPDLTVELMQNQSYEGCQSKGMLSPIEEAICSLNKKLRSEAMKTHEAHEKTGGEAEENNADVEESVKPRTRFGWRDRRRKSPEEKSGEEESSKNKKMRKELAGKELYVCGNEQCSFTAENNSSLKDHLYVCDFSRVSSVLLCPHCSKHFKHFNPYLEHLKYHGEKRFHCGLCSFSSAVESATLRHFKQKHKCHVTKAVPKDPPMEEHTVFYPKNHKIGKVDFEENGYSPGDENKLPLQSVYQVNVKCAKCPYFTKVRSNMVRHLKIHVKSAETEGVIVPSTAPTNPVPCLETKEKMFDKMTNLAASSQLAQAEKEKLTALPPEVEAKFPQFVAEHLRFKCCLPDCNYITVDDRMLKHHIKALHNEVSHYSCPHCRSTVHVDIRNAPLEKIGHHLKFHDSKLYKCGHCVYIHYQKNLVEKHSCEKHPDRRCLVQIVRDSGGASEEEHSGSEADASVWKCGRCEEFQSLSKSKLKDHLLNDHKIRASHQCQLCSMTGSGFKMFANHFASKHPGEKVAFVPLLYEQKVPSSKLGSLSARSSAADASNEHFDTTPLWQRGAPRVRHIRGILIEEEEVKTKRSKRSSVEGSEVDVTEPVAPRSKVFYCPLCTDKKKVFFTKNEDYFRTHLYQELNYQQFACILCGKMFVDKKDFDKHHARMHPDKPPEMNQTKEDGEIIFWVDKVIAKQREQMREGKRKSSEAESSESSSPSKKKEV